MLHIILLLVETNYSSKKMRIITKRQSIAYLGIADDCSSAKCSIWGNMELKALNIN